MTDEERREAKEHSDALQDLREILATQSGISLFTYLFKELEVGELPELGLEGSILMDKLGSLRAGRAVFDLVSEANAEVAGAIVAKNKKDYNARLYRQYAEDNADTIRQD